MSTHVTATIHDTFTIERTYKASPERTFAAWADPKQKRTWFGESEGCVVESFEVDFRVGGFERSRFRFGNGPRMGNDTVHHDIVDNRRIVSSYVMTIGDERISASLATIEIAPGPKGQGTQLRFTEQAVFFESGDGPQMRRQGWSQILDKLGQVLDAS